MHFVKFSFILYNTSGLFNQSVENCAYENYRGNKDYKQNTLKLWKGDNKNKIKQKMKNAKENR